MIIIDKSKQNSAKLKFQSTLNGSGSRTRPLWSLQRLCWWCLGVEFGKLKVDQRSLFCAIFDEKGLILEYLANILAAKKLNENSQQYLFVSENQINTIINNFNIL